MVLDADSVATVTFTDKLRSVRLDQGRAEFSVAHDSKPFQVEVGANIIRDVGTTFQVSKGLDGITVGLLSGQVTVAHKGMNEQVYSLAPQQQIHIDINGGTSGATPLDTNIAQAWTRGELIFHERPLAEIVDEVNHYSETKLRLADPSLGARVFSGTFHAGDQEGLVKALQASMAVRPVMTSKRELTLYPASITKEQR